MRHFFILGSHPSLSVAEILTVLGETLQKDEFTVTDSSRHALIIETPAGTPALDTAALMKRLGGTVKIGVMLEAAPVKESELIALMAETLEKKRAGQKTVTFGYSVYSLDAENPVNRAGVIASRFKKVGMETKRLLKEAGFSARWVAAQTGTMLTSVAVVKNKMPEEGAEFVILSKKDTWTVGITTDVQPFEEFSEHDYGRPDRDTFQGMLPPKLARLMLNVSGITPAADATVLDPFCGSGTVLTEALQIGFGHVLGSDINEKAVESSLKNAAYITEKGLAPAGAEVRTLMSDARDLAQKFTLKSIDTIVAETYLGPPRNGRETRGEIQRMLYTLGNLYYQSFSAFKKVLKPGAPVILALPAYVVSVKDAGRAATTELHGISLADFAPLGVKVEPLLPQPIMARLGDKPSKNQGLYYGRKDQLVWREIVKIRFA